MISKVYYKLRPPHEQEGREGDVVISSYNGKSFIFVKTRNKWHQTQELLPKNVSRLKESELGATNMLGNLNLGKNKIASLGYNSGLGIDSSDNKVFVDSPSGFVVHHNMYLAKSNYSKIYFDGTSSPGDYIMSSVNCLDIYAVGKGITRIQSGNTSRDDGIVIPIGDKLIFSGSDLETDGFGETTDTKYYLSRAGAEETATLGIGFYTNNEAALTLTNTYASLNKDNYELRFHDGSYYTGFKSHATMTANAMYTLPPAYPSGNKILQSDTSGNLTWVTDSTVAALTTEEVQDIVGAMFTGNTETRISATYEDGDGTIDLVADAAPITALNSATANELVTVGATTTELDAESNLTFSGTVLNTTYLEVGDNLGTAGSSAFIKQIIGHADGTSTPAALDFYKARGSEGSPSAVAQNDYLATQRYLGYDGNSYELSAAIRGDVDGSVADGEVPGMLNFLTAPTGTLQSRMVIDSGGSVGIGTWDTTSKPHNMLSVDGTIGLEERASADTDATTYGQIWVKNTDPNELWFTDGDGADIKVAPNIYSVHSHNLSGRHSSVNTWYASNQSWGTSITAADWATSKFNYSCYNSKTPVTLKSWKWVGEVSSAVNWEWELWDVTLPTNGTLAASTVAQVGSTVSVSGATAYGIYSIGVDGLSYAVAAGHQLYMLLRYTSGSGTKYSYGTLTMEFVN